MTTLRTILAALLLCIAPAQAQTLKSLMVNSTNGQVVANTGTNTLRFTNTVDFLSINTATITSESTLILQNGSAALIELDDTDINFISSQFNVGSPIGFVGTNAALNAATTRTNLGLGSTNIVTFNALNLNRGTNTLNFGPDFEVTYDQGTPLFNANNGFSVVVPVNLNGDLTINQTTASNGLLYIRRTNNEAFLGLANLIASNNTTISNESLFRVGVAEATNKAAQFGFRSTNTNGNGVAVFSVFGYNALMMIGADASTNAVIYSGGGTNNEVMTLIVDGATEFARPIRFSTNAASKPSTNAPANTTNVAAWVEFRIGTNSYRAPLYQ